MPPVAMARTTDQKPRGRKPRLTPPVAMARTTDQKPRGRKPRLTPPVAMAMRGRKIDQMRGAVCRERKREAAES